MLFTPEMSNVLDRDRSRAARSVVATDKDLVLAAAREAAAAHGVWVCIGSLAVTGEDGRLANRSFVVAPDGTIVTTYDKIHMFDVDLGDGERWTESAAYTAGNQVVVAETPIGQLGLTICYDVRFPALFDALGRSGCDVISIPAAFTVPTGRAHWHVLLRARAIEASAYVIAAAQTGRHADGRETFGHSLVVDPWGEVVLDMGTAPGLAFATIDAQRIAEVRARIPCLANRRCNIISVP